MHHVMLKKEEQVKKCVGLRRVEDQSVPLALDVVVLRLLRDVETVKLQLPRELLLPFEDHQRDLDKHEQTLFRNIFDFSAIFRH